MYTFVEINDWDYNTIIKRHSFEHLHEAAKAREDILKTTDSLASMIKDDNGNTWSTTTINGTAYPIEA